MPKRKSMIGKRFGKLTVIGELPDKLCGKTFKRIVEVRCDCGVVKACLRDSIYNYKSCGCLTIDLIRKQHQTHGKSTHRIYRIWSGMKARCYNPERTYFKNYGGRGITVCKLWLRSFDCFYNWAIKNGYKETLTLERKNVFKNYTPSNCTWATEQVQANNRTNTNRYLYRGESLTIPEISIKYKISYTMLLQRVRRYKWEIKDAVEIAEVKKSRKPSLYFKS